MNLLCSQCKPQKTSNFTVRVDKEPDTNLGGNLLPIVEIVYHLSFNSSEFTLGHRLKSNSLAK